MSLIVQEQHQTNVSVSLACRQCYLGEASSRVKESTRKLAYVDNTPVLPQNQQHRCISISTWHKETAVRMFTNHLTNMPEWGSNVQINHVIGVRCWSGAAAPVNTICIVIEKRDRNRSRIRNLYESADLSYRGYTRPRIRVFLFSREIGGFQVVTKY